MVGEILNKASLDWQDNKFFILLNNFSCMLQANAMQDINILSLFLKKNKYMWQDGMKVGNSGWDTNVKLKW